MNYREAVSAWASAHSFDVSDRRALRHADPNSESAIFWLFALLAIAAADPPVRINDLVVLGTHNSYKLAMPTARMDALRAADANSADALDYAHRPLVEQLDAGARQLELDIWYDPRGGLYADGSTDPAMLQPGFKVQHMAGFDNRSNCLTLV